MDFVWTSLYIALYATAALAAFLGWLWRRWKTRGNPHWPMAQATVESYRDEQGRHTVTWFIVYSYSANGEYYSGEFAAQLPWASKMFKSQDKIENMVKQSYPRETKFPVRYKPEKPEVSVPFSREPMAAIFAVEI
jgi:hypothetical protein